MERIYRQGEATLKVTARRDGATLHVQSPAGQHVYEWDELGPGDYLLRANGRQRRCIVARAGDDRWVWVDGHIHHLKAESGARRRSSHSMGELVSPMPGQVVRVLVAPGDTVRKAQVLLVLEAMKMQVEIAAPRDGVVRSVHATAGAQVTGGVPLVTLADEAEEGEPA